MLQALSLWELVEARAQATPQALLAIDEKGRELSFQTYHDAAERVAAGFAARGIKVGSRVSWMLPTWTESLILVAALARLGAIQNPILPIYRRREVAFITNQSQAELLIVPPFWRNFDYPAMANEIAAQRDGLEVFILDDALPEAELENLAGIDPVSGAANQPAVRWLFYSSGTTAEPKGALHSDTGLLAASEGICSALSLQADDRVALVFPFTHIGGIGWLLSALLVGCTHLVVPIFEPKTSIPFLAEHGVTQATAGTAFHQAYLAEQRRQPERPLFPKVRSFPGGGAPKPPQLHYEMKQEMGGVGIVSGYGMTECPIVSMNTVTASDEKLAHTEGKANPSSMQIRVAKPDGSLATAHEEGELRVRGPQLFQGYLDDRLNEDAFDEDGYFCTGDLGYVDQDGYLIITGRLKDVIIRKGENVSVKEIEDLLHAHPQIGEVAVIGLLDVELGERVCAVIAPSGSEDLPGYEEIATFLKNSGLMVQKIPEQLEYLDKLPRNATGKVLKNELRQRYEKQDPTIRRQA